MAGVYILLARGHEGPIGDSNLFHWGPQFCYYWATKLQITVLSCPIRSPVVRTKQTWHPGPISCFFLTASKSFAKFLLEEEKEKNKTYNNKTHTTQQPARHTTKHTTTELKKRNTCNGWLVLLTPNREGLERIDWINSSTLVRELTRLSREVIIQEGLGKHAWAFVFIDDRPLSIGVNSH